MFRSRLTFDLADIRFGVKITTTHLRPCKVHVEKGRRKRFKGGGRRRRKRRK